MKRLAICLLVLGSAVTAACGGDAATEESAGPPGTVTTQAGPEDPYQATSTATEGATSDLVGRWRLVSLTGEEAPRDRGVTISFTDTHVGGSNGCNNYGAAYEIDGTTLVFDGFLLTLIACFDADGNIVIATHPAGEVMSALVANPQFAVEGDELTIETESTSFVFVRLTEE